MTKTSNFYFLVISVMQTFEVISISGGVPVQAGPLAVVVIVSMIKDAYEDYKRYLSDLQENEAKTSFLEVKDNGKSSQFLEK